MSLSITSAELAQLEAAMTTLLSPLSYERVDDWRSATRHDIERLLGADISGSLLSLAGEPYANADPELAEGAAAYASYFHRLDTGLHVVRRARGLDVFSVHDIYDWPTYRKSEIYADWNARYRLFDSIAMAVEVGEQRPAATLHFYHEHETRRSFGEHGLAMLRLLRPAFVAGVHTLMQFHARRAALADALDRSGQAVLVADVAGRPIHASPGFEQLLAEDPAHERVRDALASVAGLLAARLRRPRATDPARPEPETACSVEVATAYRRYRVHGDYAGRHALGPETTILLTLTPVREAPPQATVIRERFRLTPRETAVAQLAADRRSAREIADLLHIRYHTARRHLEHVYEKFAVHSRAQLDARLRGDPLD